MKRVLIVGAGFSGAVLARQFADIGGVYSLVIDERVHIGGNCHTERDHQTGVLVHRYGPHIFHTDRGEVWDYVRRFGKFRPFVNRVKATIEQGVFSLPVNLHTINQFFGLRLSPDEAKAYIASKGDAGILEPANLEEQALKFLGEELYEAFFRGYTIKQWGCAPNTLPASILKRLPVRFNYDDNYYHSRYQGMPEEGYTEVIRRMLQHEKIEVQLGTMHDFNMHGEFEHVFFTGPIDAYFGQEFGALSYRTVFWNRIDAVGDYQGNAVMNYPSLDVDHTRVLEPKHFTPWESHDKTVAFVEYSKETMIGDIPYYPKRLANDNEKLIKYLALAADTSGTSFLGRLATYRYMDMDQVIGEALDFTNVWLKARHDGLALPVMPSDARI
jgi:UDP-galactopyranose mutase